MKNTVITSISALVFLIIGLFIGKSNRQIEIQEREKHNKQNTTILDAEEIPETIKSFAIHIKIDECLTNRFDLNSIKNKIELELSEIGLNVTTRNQSDADLVYDISAIKIESNKIFSYSSHLSIVKLVNFEINSHKYSNLSTIWENERFGYFYDNESKDILGLVKSQIDAMSFSILITKLKEK